MRPVMTRSLRYQGVVRAFASALAAVALLVVIEGAVLMELNQQWGYEIVRPRRRAAHPIDFAVCHPCGRGVALVRMLPENPRDRYQWMIVVQGLGPSTDSIEFTWPGPPARVVAAIPQSPRAMVGCTEGEL